MRELGSRLHTARPSAGRNRGPCRPPRRETASGRRPSAQRPGTGPCPRGSVAAATRPDSFQEELAVRVCIRAPTPQGGSLFTLWQKHFQEQRQWVESGATRATQDRGPHPRACPPPSRPRGSEAREPEPGPCPSQDTWPLSLTGGRPHPGAGPGSAGGGRASAHTRGAAPPQRAGAEGLDAGATGGEPGLLLQGP